MKKTKKELRILINIIYIVYLLALLYVVFGLDRAEQSEYHYNLVLFNEIKRFFKYRKILGNMPFLLNMIGNVGGFLPFGFMLPIINRKYENLFFVTLLSFEFSLFIELIQLIFKVGIFDVDDIFLNTLGGCIGYLLYYGMKGLRRKSRGGKK